MNSFTTNTTSASEADRQPAHNIMASPTPESSATRELTDEELILAVDASQQAGSGGAQDQSSSQYPESDTEKEWRKATTRIVRNMNILESHNQDLNSDFADVHEICKSMSQGIIPTGEDYDEDSLARVVAQAAEQMVAKIAPRKPKRKSAAGAPRIQVAPGPNNALQSSTNVPVGIVAPQNIVPVSTGTIFLRTLIGLTLDRTAGHVVVETPLVNNELCYSVHNRTLVFMQRNSYNAAIAASPVAFNHLNDTQRRSCQLVVQPAGAYQVAVPIDITFDVPRWLSTLSPAGTTATHNLDTVFSYVYHRSDKRYFQEHIERKHGVSFQNRAAATAPPVVGPMMPGAVLLRCLLWFLLSPLVSFLQSPSLLSPTRTVYHPLWQPHKIPQTRLKTSRWRTQHELSHDLSQALYCAHLNFFISSGKNQDLRTNSTPNPPTQVIARLRPKSPESMSQSCFIFTDIMMQVGLYIIIVSSRGSSKFSIPPSAYEARLKT